MTPAKANVNHFLSASNPLLFFKAISWVFACLPDFPKWPSQNDPESHSQSAAPNSTHCCCLCTITKPNQVLIAHLAWFLQVQDFSRRKGTIKKWLYLHDPLKLNYTFCTYIWRSCTGNKVERWLVYFPVVVVIIIIIIIIISHNHVVSDWIL